MERRGRLVATQKFSLTWNRTETVDNENVDFQLLSHWLFELNKYEIARVTCANGHAEKMTGQTIDAREIEYSTVVRKPAGLAHLCVQDEAMYAVKEKRANHAQFDKTTYDKVLKNSTNAIRHLQEKEYIISVGGKHHAMMIYTKKIGDKNHQKGKAGAYQCTSRGGHTQL